MASWYQRGDEAMQIEVPCRPEYVRTIRRAIADFAGIFDITGPVVQEMEVAISEAVANIIRHAYNDCAGNPPVKVRCAHRDGGFTVEVVDRGCGFSAPADNIIPDIDFDREGGLGIILIKSLMDRVTYVSRPHRGTRIRMSKRVDGVGDKLAGTGASRPKSETT